MIGIAFFCFMIKILKASIEDLPDLAPLFNDYRVFYEQPSDLVAAELFLHKRITNDQSTIFMARHENKAVGFTQIYPVFSSVSMRSLHILNDLFVDESTRGLGIATLLLNEAKTYAMMQGSKGLTLETHNSNPAQKLYERLDFIRDDEYYHYMWKNPSL